MKLKQRIHHSLKIKTNVPLTKVSSIMQSCDIIYIYKLISVFKSLSHICVKNRLSDFSGEDFLVQMSVNPFKDKVC